MDLTLQRHLPDISDTSLAPGPSEVSFQIPHTATTTAQLLMDDDCSGFLCGMDTTISTPAHGMKLQRDDPLTLAELTPRSKPPRGPSRRSARKAKPASSSRKQIIEPPSSAAMDTTLSSRKQPDFSFQIPKIGNDISELLMENDCDELFAKGAECSFPGEASFRKPSTEALTLSQLTPDHIAETSGTHDTGELSEPCLLNAPTAALSVLRAELESLVEGGERSGHTTSEGLCSALPSHAVRAPSNYPGIPDISQNNASTDADVQPCPVPRESCSKPEQDVQRSVPPRASDTKLNQRKRTAKQSVIEGGIVKQFKPKVPTNAATRHKAISQRRLGKQAVPPPRSSSASLATGADAGTSSEKITPPSTGCAQADLVSYGQQLANVRDTQVNIHFSASGSDLPRAANDSNQFCDSASHMPASARNPDLDRPSSCHEQSTHRGVSPSEGKVRVTEEAAPCRAGSGGSLSLTLQQHETTLNAPRETPMTYPVAPPSPMRSSTKRPANADSDVDSAPAKRGRVVSPQFESTATRAGSNFPNNVGPSMGTRARSKALQSSHGTSGADHSRSVAGGSEPAPSKRKSATSIKRRVNKPISASGAAPRPLTKSTSRTSEHAGVARQVTGSDASTSGHASAKPGESSNGNASSRSGYFDSENHLERAARSTSALNDRHGHMSKSTGKHAPTRLAVSLPPAKVTKPIEFHFHSDARIEARKKDFACTMHEAEAQRLAARKEQIAPILPGHVELNTEARAHEREKYDEARRTRGQEAERLLEEKRRLQALEEDKEIRELRRRAVPKANEVPDWYAHAPKRSRDTKVGRRD